MDAVVEAVSQAVAEAEPETAERQATVTRDVEPVRNTLLPRL